jgi:Fur family ferric uptake transcriptional regulator
VHEKVRAEQPSIGLATVYRTLQMLKEIGVVCELSSPGAMHTYTLAATESHHHHLVCTKCGTVVDFTTSNLDELAQRLALETGFVIHDHVLEFAGVCPGCSRNSVFNEHKA